MQTNRPNRYLFFFPDGITVPGQSDTLGGFPNSPGLRIPSNPPSPRVHFLSSPAPIYIAPGVFASRLRGSGFKLRKLSLPC